MNAAEKALSAATILLTEDHYLVEAIEARRRNREFFRPDYDQELKSTRDHLTAIELEASAAATLCAVAGFENLATLCRKISQRIWQANVAGRDDLPATPDLSRLASHAVEALDFLSDIHQPV